MADTSFLIALFDEADPRKGTATALASSDEPIEVQAEVVGETLGLVHRRNGYSTALTIWRALHAIPHLYFSEEVDHASTERCFLEAKGRLSWVDAAVVARCRAREATPLAFDEELEKAARA